ncbi:MAG: alpha/beta hydrolase [Patescibacteria group bacterium]|nr:alpha/beta hydrolase [Patescibacteria group bacterium]
MSHCYLVYLHGGTAFESREDYLNYLKNKEVRLEKVDHWSGDYLDENLPSYIKLTRPHLPCKENARFDEWRIVFEKYLELLEKEEKPVVFLGYSLGAVFLVKYLSNYSTRLRIPSLHLVAPPFDDQDSPEPLRRDFWVRGSLSQVSRQCQKIYFYFSFDDPIIPLSHMVRYQKKLPLANYLTFKDKEGHFRVAEFPELILAIKESLA